jgi:glutaredoxin
VSTGPDADSGQAIGPGLTVFSSPLCGPCERMKAWLAERGHDFVVRDVMMDPDAGELLESHDIRTTPVLQVGDRFVIGFDVAAMEAALAATS